ncbi:MAG TPA: heme-binding protein [Methylocella sp.]|nr:heme-binding protein [Methylocella sp.]
MKIIQKTIKWVTASVLALGVASAVARADDSSGEAFSCQGLPTHNQLQKQLSSARAEANGGFNLDMWGTVVNRDGIVCAVAFTGSDRGSEWPGSRVISAQKAYTANAFSLPGLSLSTANLYAAVQPGGSLYGLQHSNPVSPEDAYLGPAANFGQPNDPMVGRRVGGVNVFGGGLALYDSGHNLVGAIGVSGDTSCADHNIAWRTRHKLKLDYVPGGVNDVDPTRPDNINYAGIGGVVLGTLAFDFSHPVCKIKNVDGVSNISLKKLPPTR